MYPYLVWSLITGGLQITLSNYVNSKVTFHDLMRIWYCPLPAQHYWFLYTLFLMYLSYVFCDSFFRSFSPYIFLFFSLFMFFSGIHTNVRIIDKYVYNVTFFALGVFLSKNTLIIKRFFDKNISWFFVFLTIVAFCGCEVVCLLICGKFEGLAVKLVIAVMGIATVIMLSKFLSDKGNLFALEKVGQCSLYIYLPMGCLAADPESFSIKFSWLKIRLCIWSPVLSQLELFFQSFFMNGQRKIMHHCCSNRLVC